MKPAAPDNAVFLHVFGCQMNKLDAELVRAALAERGYAFVREAEEAGVILFITCSVREHAEERVHSRLGLLKRLKRRRPGLVVGLLGCMAEEHGPALFRRHPHLDIVCGTRDFAAVADLVERVRAGEEHVAAVGRAEQQEIRREARLRPSRFSAYLAVMRGCEQYCAYCIVPFVRGREESRPAEEVEDEARRLLRDGVKEITLLGQAVNRYDDGRGTRLAGLLRRLDALPGLRRLHFVTSYPAHVDADLVAAVRDCRTVTRFLHIPAQSGSDAVLARMNRRYTAAEYLDTIARLRAAVPDIEFGSDFIVGFPGETEEEFQATVDLVEAARFQQAFVFKYSPRPGTEAARRWADDVAPEVKQERNRRLLDVQERIGLEKNEAMVGREAEVLVVGRSRRDSARFSGRTVYNQIVAFPGDESMVGKIARVPIEACTALTLLGGRATEVRD